MAMATKDTEARALLDALCDWLVHDAKFNPEYVALLRVRFEQELQPRGMQQRDSNGKDARR